MELTARRLAVRVLLQTTLLAMILLGLVEAAVGVPCLRLGPRWGVWPARCPATDLRLDVHAEVSGAVRGREGGTLTLTPRAHWLTGRTAAAGVDSALLRRGFRWKLALVDPEGRTSVPSTGRVRRTPYGTTLPLTLPDVADGDYLLRVSIDAGFESAELEVPLALYAPAIVHVLADRPLYRPGQDVFVRSVVLERDGLRPVEGRPGQWRFVDPDGVELYAEDGVTGPWGVADTRFPLDTGAKMGTWTVSFRTGHTDDAVTFDVRPFQLPRATVELAGVRTWFAPGDELAVEGIARTTSGAPVALAPVVARLRPSSGRWPAPVEWSGPRAARTGPDGRFRVSWGQVPADLIDRATFAAEVGVTDLAGIPVAGQTALVLSEDPLTVQVLTESGEALVPSANNRMYLRLTRPDGAVLPDTNIVVRSGPGDPGKPATTDADGVAALQFAPGPPVTVVIPALPRRPSPVAAPAPALAVAMEVGDGAELDLAERRALDALIPALAACQVYSVGTNQVAIGLEIDPGGRARRVVGADGPLERCVADVARTVILPAGAARTYQLQWALADAGLPAVHWSTSYAYGAGDDAPFAAAGLAARTCLTIGQGVDGAAILDVHWSVAQGKRVVGMSIDERIGHGLSAAAITCLRNELAQVALAEPAAQDVMAVSTARLSVPPLAGAEDAGPTTRTAYPLEVSASGPHGEPLGSAHLVVEPGTPPPLRIRPEEALVDPGQTVRVELLRGPGFVGELPDELTVTPSARVPVRGTQAEITIPADARGFLTIAGGGARALVFVRNPEPLSVALFTMAQRYRPGDTATLTVTTRAGDHPTPAAVTLVGVDAALGQLVPLPGPDDFARVTVQATTGTPAFGTFEAKTLPLGQINGEHAAHAAVLAVQTVVERTSGDDPASGSGEAASDVTYRLADSFYRALRRVTEKVRAWEQGTPDAERFTPGRMVGLWDETLAELRREGTPAVDGYGRELALPVLPPELLALTDPRSLVRDGTRLPEDYVGWDQYVATEVQ